MNTERVCFSVAGLRTQPIRGNGLMDKLMNRLLRQAGIGARCSVAYVLRHTLASNMVHSGASFREVAEILGLVTVTTTGIYAKLDLPRASCACLERYPF